jgi:putative phosphoesterase
MTQDTTSIGVISDTHGLLRDEALAALRGTSLIVHAGDIGASSILAGLRELAPVVAVRGNNDREAWADALAATEVVEVAGVLLYVVHDRHDLDLDPAGAGFHAVISGHSHRPAVERHNGVIFVNPGSAGPRRFSLPVAVALLTVTRGSIDARIVQLDV